MVVITHRNKFLLLLSARQIVATHWWKQRFLETNLDKWYRMLICRSISKILCSIKIARVIYRIITRNHNKIPAYKGLPLVISLGFNLHWTQIWINLVTNLLSETQIMLILLIKTIGIKLKGKLLLFLHLV